MNLSLLRCSLPFVALLAAVGLSAQQVTIADELFPGATATGSGPYLTRLVDDLSGEPIAGAEVFLVAESDHPIAGEFWFTHRGVSEADGFVRIPQPDGKRGWYWQVMKHPTLGVAERGDHVAPIWRLGRTFDVPLEVQDWAGRPAGGARIGFCGGCGHSPDIATATAAANGFAVLRGIDPQQGIADLYVQHPGLHFFYDSVRWRPGEPPMVVQCAFGPAQTGRVVDHDGQPVAGAFVCGGGKHRGPWARTAADGSFTVLGARPDDYPFKVVTPTGRDVYFDVHGPDPYPVTLRLPDLGDPAVHHGPVETTANPPAVPPQTRRVRVLVEDAPTEVVSLTVYYPGQPDGGGEDPAEVEVPVGAPFVLTVTEDAEQRAEEREFPFADGAAVPDPLVVRWPRQARVSGRAVDAAGAPIAARVRWRDSWSDGDDDSPWHAAAAGFEVAADVERGWQLFEVATTGQEPPSRLLWVLVPGYGGRVDLGDVVVGRSPQLRVLDANGAPLPDAEVSFARPGWQEVGDTHGWPVDEGGAWLGPDLREGDAVVVQRGGSVLPFRTVLRGAGPWTIVPPAGALDLDIVAPDGTPLAAAVVVGDHCAEANEGRVALRGLPHGAMRCYVSAPGHRSAIVDATIPSAGGLLRVELPPR